MKKLLLICLAIICCFPASGLAQIALFPTATFIDPATRTGSMQVINNSDEVREIEISLRFGYFAFDSLGNSYTQFNDTVAEKNYSLIPFVRVFPQKLVIPPKEQQTIRFLISGIPEDKEQFYWSRIVATSVPETPQVDSVEKGKVQATLVLKTEMIGLVAFLKGSNTSDLDYQLDGTYSDSIKLNLVVRHDRVGNSPFWGLIHTEIFNSNNDLVTESSEPAAIYFSCRQKLAFDKGKFTPGHYSARITVTNEREEVPEDYRPKIAQKTKQFSFDVK